MCSHQFLRVCAYEMLKHSMQKSDSFMFTELPQSSLASCISSTRQALTCPLVGMRTLLTYEILEGSMQKNSARAT